MESAEQWYTHTMGSMNGDWDDLQDRFCLAFCPISRVIALLKEVLGAAWARISLLIQSGPDLSLPDHVLLQHFCLGLNKDSSYYLDITAGGLFTHKTTTEVRSIPDKILENIYYIDHHNEPIQKVGKSSNKDHSTAEYKPLPLSSPDPAVEISRKHKY